MNNFDFVIGEKVLIIEKTHTEEIFEWEGEVIEVNETFVKTKHRRNPITHPQWTDYFRAYMETWVKHYGINGIGDNIKKILT